MKAGKPWITYSLTGMVWITNCAIQQVYTNRFGVLNKVMPHMFPYIKQRTIKVLECE